MQRSAKLDFVAVGDFGYYDQMLNLTALLGALSERFGFDPSALSLAQYYELARGNKAQPAMEMTKWFDTNYHYLVPDTTFNGGVNWFFDEIDEALALNHSVKPVPIGPITYLWLSKSHIPGFDRLSLLPKLVIRYMRILDKLKERGIDWIQPDEPALCLDLDDEWLEAFHAAYDVLGALGNKVLLGTYFDTAALPADKVLSVGVIDGRNIWRADLNKIVDSLQSLSEERSDNLWIAPSCSLLHVPVTLASEKRLDNRLTSWLAFATEKLDEVSAITLALRDPAEAGTVLGASNVALDTRRNSDTIINTLVQRRTAAAITHAMASCKSSFAERKRMQRHTLRLPLLPTTTIGSFPQTPAIRQARAAYRRGELGVLDYLEHACARRSQPQCASRRNSGSTYSCTAKRNATTWSSFLPRSRGDMR
ncbi:MAG: 5-methyltetrahydropteroyltriglutamate--homocysteine methyltransferase (EC [uncultured Caballeronia sp.]|nr:MAG: 5-methyltetrahydropteroyltriglutamate--homocysteine methyltransferase (EC [uncultured Caballeronia sp.]